MDKSMDKSVNKSGNKSMNSVRGQVWGQVGGQVRGQVWEQVRRQVWEQVSEQVWGQVWEQVREQVSGQVGEQVWEGDSIVLLLESPYHSYYQIEVDTEGRMFDADREGFVVPQWYSMADVEIEKGTDYWTAKITLPIAILGEEGAEGDPMNYVVSSRIEAGQVDLMIEQLDLHSMVAEIVSEMKRLSAEASKPVAFEMEIPADLPPIEGDTLRIRQVLYNLISNAFQYTPSGGMVQVRVRTQDGHVRVDVQDNGIGIALENHHRIFERFYRGDDPLVQSAAGTGLGLAISRTMIEMHGGKIWFVSSGKRREGSTFSFTLPLRQEDDYG